MYNTKALRSRLSNLETNNMDIMTNEYIKCMDVLQYLYQVLVEAFVFQLWVTLPYQSQT
jgi:hypothetical protein